LIINSWIISFFFKLLYPLICRSLQIEINSIRVFFMYESIVSVTDLIIILFKINFKSSLEIKFYDG